MPDANVTSYKAVAPTSLRKHFQQHQDWLAGNGGVRLTLEGLDLREYEIPEHSTIKKAIFNSCCFSSRQFGSIDLTDCEFFDCDLSDVVFKDTVLGHTIFKARTNLDRAQFRTSLCGTVFNLCSLVQTDFEGCKFSIHPQRARPIFEQCNGKKTVFARCKLTYVQFRNVNFSRADFKRAILEHVSFTSDHDPVTSVVSSDFTDAEFHDCNVQGGDFVHCTFLRTKFPKTVKKHLSVRNSTFRQASFERSTLNDISVDRASFAQSTGLFGRFGASLNNIKGGASAKYGPKCDVCSWSLVRKFGSIPLFGVSYLALITIWIWASSIEWYNQ